MATKRIPKVITNKADVDYILALDADSGQRMSVVTDLFGIFDGKQRFHPYDIITVPAGTYGPEGHKNKNDFTTTIGRWIFNRVAVEPELFNVLGYINKPLTDGELKNINSKLSYAVLEDKITVEQMKNYINTAQKFQGFTTFICPSCSMDMLTISKKVEKKKKELMDTKYGEAIKNGDDKAASALEKDLLAYCREELKDDPGMDMYDSGMLSFNNNFKNIFVMKGAVKDPDPTKGYNIITSNYIDGIKKEEYSAFANGLAAGPYARAKKTEVFGYYEKLFLSAYQHVILDEPGSDCGTKEYITVTLDKSMIHDMMYSYIIEGNRLVELTSENADKYKDKTVKMRFASLCKNPKKCNMCAGNLFYRMGIKNVGVATPQLASKVKVITMKGFHDSTMKYSEMDPMKAFGLK